MVTRARMPSKYFGKSRKCYMGKQTKILHLSFLNVVLHSCWFNVSIHFKPHWNMKHNYVSLHVLLQSHNQTWNVSWQYFLSIFNRNSMIQPLKCQILKVQWIKLLTNKSNTSKRKITYVPSNKAWIHALKNRIAHQSIEKLQPYH